MLFSFFLVVTFIIIFLQDRSHDDIPPLYVKKTFSEGWSLTGKISHVYGIANSYIDFLENGWIEENIENGNQITNDTLLEEDNLILEGNLFGKFGYIICQFCHKKLGKPLTFYKLVCIIQFMVQSTNINLPCVITS